MGVDRIRAQLHVNGVRDLSLDGMLNAAGKNPGDFCNACFTTRYPIPVPDGARSR